MDPSYEAPTMESRTLYGLTLEQKRNDAVINGSLFSNEKIVTSNKQVGRIIPVLIDRLITTPDNI